MALRVLTWNLYHGRAVPPAGRSLLAEFATTLRDWEWDVALLQEVPPWWGSELARAADAQRAVAPTARTGLTGLRRALARRWPDVVKSGAGSANAILVRGGRRIVEHRVHELRDRPERRVVHAVSLDDGCWAANLHATVHDDARARAEIAHAARSARAWAGDAPLVLGGDLNVRDPSVDGLAHAAGEGVDHVFVRGLEAEGAMSIPPRGRLSDHPAIAVTLRPL